MQLKKVMIFLHFFPFSDRIIHIGLRTAGAAAGESPAAGKRETGAGSCKAGYVPAGLPSPVRSRHCKQVAHCPESGTDIPDSHWSLWGREGGCCVRICKSGNLPAAGAGGKSGSRGIGRAGLGWIPQVSDSDGKDGSICMARTWECRPVSVAAVCRNQGILSCPVWSAILFCVMSFCFVHQA